MIRGYFALPRPSMAAKPNICMTKPGVTLTGEMRLWEDETPIGTGLPMLFDFLDEVRIQNIEVK